MTDPRRVAVMFSGGRDSSLAACLLAREGCDVSLLRCSYGFTHGEGLVEYRKAELQKAFPGNFLASPTISVIGLFRQVAIVDIESDFSRFRKNLLTLGAQLAFHAGALSYCLREGIKEVNSGFSGYQQGFPEQRREAVELLRNFFGEYGIEYLTPIIGYSSEDEVKYGLLEFGLSTKSLETTSVFGDTGTSPDSQTVVEYIGSKLDVCRAYVDRMGKRIPKVD